MTTPHKIAGICEVCQSWVELAWSVALRGWVCSECASPRVDVPAPGSIDAAIEGCECDPELNNQGRLQPEIGWYVFSGCPVHDPIWPEATA